jgi:predicted  nucleic acid-binding Zn-ribbon protein
MSTDDVIRIKSAYEKMLEDGTAFKEVDMSMMTEPNVEQITGLGEEVVVPKERKQEQDPDRFIDEHTDFSHLDNAMEQRMNSLRAKMGGVKSKKVRENESREIALLKKRVEKLEEALMLVMETHEKLL